MQIADYCIFYVAQHRTHPFERRVFNTGPITTADDTFVSIIRLLKAPKALQTVADTTELGFNRSTFIAGFNNDNKRHRASRAAATVALINATCQRAVGNIAPFATNKPMRPAHRKQSIAALHFRTVTPRKRVAPNLAVLHA